MINPSLYSLRERVYEFEPSSQICGLTMTLIEQISAQKALMESKGAIALRLECGELALHQILDEAGVTITAGDKNNVKGMAPICGMQCALNPNMEGFAILATWPETQ